MGRIGSVHVHRLRTVYGPSLLGGMWIALLRRMHMHTRLTSTEHTHCCGSPVSVHRVRLGPGHA